MTILDTQLIESLSSEQILHLLERADARLKDETHRADATVLALEGANKDLHAALAEITRLTQHVDALSNRLELMSLADLLEVITKHFTSDSVIWYETIPKSHYPDVMDFIKHMWEGQKIHAIKTVRAVTGLGLKECKEFVEGPARIRWEDYA